MVACPAGHAGRCQASPWGMVCGTRSALTRGSPRCIPPPSPGRTVLGLLSVSGCLVASGGIGRGRRVSLWDEVEAACRWWRDTGSPGAGAWKVACGGGCCSAPVHGTLIQLLGMSASWCRCAEPLRVGSSATYLSSCKNELNSAGSLTAMAPLSTSMAFPGVMSEN